MPSARRNRSDRRVSADGKGPDLRNTPRDGEARAALNRNLARQQEIALGKRVANTQAQDSIRMADEQEEQQGWMA